MILLERARIIIEDSENISAKAQLMHAFGNYYNKQLTPSKILLYYLLRIIQLQIID